MSQTSPSQPEIKRIVTGYWHSRADQYDRAPQHVVTTAAFEERWLQLLTKNLATTEAEPLDVADLGTGTGYLALLLARLGHRVTGVDHSEAMLGNARAKAEERGLDVSWRQGDVEALPFEDASLDAVTERHVLWTMADPAAALREWLRVLKPGGTLVHVGGDWSTLAPASDAPDENDPFSYHRIQDSLPLMGGADAERICALLEEAGFVEPTVTPLAEELYWEAHDPARPTLRYAIRARRPRL